jgi:hypothetical protein
MASFRRHERGMGAALNVREKLIVPRGTIRKALMCSPHGLRPAEWCPLLVIVILIVLGLHSPEKEKGDYDYE